MRLKGYSGMNFRNIKGFEVNIFNKKRVIKYKPCKIRYFEISSIEGDVTDDIPLNDKKLVLTLSLLL